MKKAIKVILGIIIALILLFAVWLVVLTVTEFKPDDVEDAEITSQATGILSIGDEVKIMTWNLGYGALGDNADFFMDGGKGVMTASKDRVSENMSGILSAIRDISPNIAMFQEVDINSMRSHGVDEADYLRRNLDGMDDSFAYNYRSLFVPYPIPPIGLVNGGVYTMSDYSIAEAKRYALPSPYSWPLSLGNLKRCIVVNRIPISDSDKELVIVNLHLEAYDSGEGKIAQTNMLKEILNEEAEAGNYIVAGGDFNQIFSNVDSDFEVYDGMWQPGMIDVADFEGWQLVMDGTTPSCRSLDKPYVDADKDSFQYYIIDGFIVSSNIKIESVNTKNLDFENSDHNPVVMTFKFE
ncbi:MAG: endonuclease [Lachnospiraceae bacterium]|nr:endonuclease [Lachnospiraceae bacterium]